MSERRSQNEVHERVQRAFRTIIPRQRRAIGWRQISVLVLFLGAYAATCIGLELTNRILFVRPAAFALMIFSVWVWWLSVAGYSGLSSKRATMALLIRLSLLGLFVVVLAEPRSVRTRDVLSVVYALDISDSIGEEATDEALQFVAKTVTEKPDTDEAGLVVFGRNAAVELPPRRTLPVEATEVLNSLIDRDATNLEQALSLSAAMLPEENRGRIVLISDGTETIGSLGQVTERLKTRGIGVDVVPIDYDYEHEVWVERLELPLFVKVGENYKASAILSSLKAGTGTLVLKERIGNDEQVLERRPITFDAGKSRHDFRIYLRDPGYYEYSATIEVAPEHDHLKQNNTALNYLYIEGQGRVLLVTDPDGDDRDWTLLEKALRAGERVVETQTSFELPRDPLALLPYDCIVFVNVGADAFDAKQLESVRESVFNQGTGLLMIGGANSFGPGGFHRTAIEEALPVSMDITKKKVLPKGALAIILHTCEFPEGNTWGKRITKQAIKVLGAQDDVGVLVYGMNGEEWLFPLTPAAEYPMMAKKINGAQIGDMPSFATTMNLGLQGLKASDAAAKHMIIISDGDASAPPPELVSEFIANDISVTMVAVFPHGGMDISKMRSIAAATGGKYYFPADARQLPAIFIKEAKTLKRSMIQNRTLTPNVGWNSSVLDGLEGLPPVHGYVITTPKDRAETVLVTPPREGKNDDDIDPILAVWNYGLGTTAAFTSDLSPNWGADWTAWDRFRPFLKQLMTRISRVHRDSYLHIWTHVSGNNGVVVVEDHHPDETFLNLNAFVRGPGSRTETITLEQVGPRRYRTSLPLWGKGRYQVHASATGDGREETVHGGFIVPYSPEYMRFRSNPVVLGDMADTTGGEELSSETPSDVIFGRRSPKESSQPIFDWLLVALACLVPFDVAVRRVQLDWSVVRGWLRPRSSEQESTATMGTLLQRKQEIDRRLDTGRSDEAPARAERPTRPTSDRKSEAAKAATEAPAKRPPQPAADGPKSTTAQLLEMKRRRDEETSR